MVSIAPQPPCWEDAWFGKAVLVWDDETRTLSIQRVKAHAGEHIIWYGPDGAAAFDAKAALESINYNFGERTTPSLPASLAGWSRS